MTNEELIAGAALACVILYGTLGGADFGGGIWDLFARGPRRDAQRAAIARAMGPVWEANHVWLIFVIVLLFTAFPSAFARLSVELFGLFHLVLVGITLRGASFVFRGPKVNLDRAAGWGAVFGMASVITPALLGMAVGAVTSGDMASGVTDAPRRTPWLTPLALAIGALALALCAYLAAVYLTIETEGDLQEDFRRRALLAGGFVVALAVLLLPLIHEQSEHLWEGLTSLRAAPVLAFGAAAALASGWLLLRRRYRLARVSSILEVALLLAGWGMAQYPYLIYPDVTIASAAAPPATLRFLVYTLPVGAALLVPSLALLFRVFKHPPTH
jgi:cytochrome d ubiquinol oxidase subunit II